MEAFISLTLSQLCLHIYVIQSGQVFTFFVTDVQSRLRKHGGKKFAVVVHFKLEDYYHLLQQTFLLLLFWP